VRYTEFDRGSRAEFNAKRLRQNAGRFEKAAKTVQRRIARFKARQVYYVRQIRESERSTPAREDRASAWERTLHARKRAALVHWLIAELDRLFYQLIGQRENQLVRYTVWSNRLYAWRYRRELSLAPGRVM
jgi:hypothetical protein